MTEPVIHCGICKSPLQEAQGVWKHVARVGQPHMADANKSDLKKRRDWRALNKGKAL